DLEPAHALYAGSDHPRLPLLLRGQPGVRPRRVDEADDRQAELVRQIEHAHGLAVAARVAHAEVARDVLLGVAALLLADDDDLPAAELSQARDHRGVIAEGPVSVQFGETREG